MKCISAGHISYQHIARFGMECILAGHILYRHIAHFSMECISAGHILYQHIARFGMECISAGHILYLRPSISRLSTSARPPHHPPHMHHHQKLHRHLHQHQHPNHLSISSTHRQIHFCQEKLEEVLTGTVFQFGTFLQRFARASRSTVDSVVAFWFC